MGKRGSDFERAVFEFVKALDPSAKVLFDHKVSDRDTGSLRQVDVWVQAQVANHFPISVLISCKDHARKVNVSHIDTFVSEVRSTGASTGVIYSHSGFTSSALAKARSHGLSCCRLYQDEPADIPQSVVFPSFLCKSNFRLELIRVVGVEGLTVWNELFDLTVQVGDESKTVLDLLEETFQQREKEQARASQTSTPQWPKDWRTEATVTPQSGPFFEIRIAVVGLWCRYRGRVEAHLLRGSYCLTDGQFRGLQVGPRIDVKGSHPGPGWEQLPNDECSLLPSRCMFGIALGGDLKEPARRHYGSRPLPACGGRDEG